MTSHAFPVRPWLQALLLVLPLVWAPAAAPQATGPASVVRAASSNADAAWTVGVDRFLEAHFAVNPVAAVYAGRHEFDGRLPDLGAEAIRQDVARLETERARVAAFDPAPLSEPNRRERAWLLAALDVDLFWKKEAEWPFRNPAWYLGIVDPEIDAATGDVHGAILRLAPHD